MLIVVPDDVNDKSYFLDINIVNGYPEMVHFEGNTQDQRAALSAVTMKGTIPGMLEEGISWGEMLQNQNNLVSLDNQVKQNVQKNAGSGDASKLVTYTPLYQQAEDGSVTVALYRS